MKEKLKIVARGAYSAIKNHYMLFGILVFGFAVRWYGIYFDYPNGVNNIWDEIFSVSVMLDMVQYKTLFTPSMYTYPFLLPLMYIPVLALRMLYFIVGNGLYGMNEIKDFLVNGGMGQLYIVVRWYSVFFGTATMFVLYKIYRPIFKNIWSVYFGVFAYSVSLIPLFLSHWGKAHSAMIFFFVLSLYFVLRFEREKRMSYFWASVATAAGAFSIHYIGITAGIFPLAGLWFNRERFTWGKTFRAAFLYGGIVLFFYISNLQGIIAYLQSTGPHLGVPGHPGIAKVEMLDRFTYLFVDSFKLEPFLAVFVIILFFNLKRMFKDRILRYVFAGLVVNYLLMIAIIAWPEMTRWRALFVTLMLPLSAGIMMEYLLENKFKKITIAVLASLVLAPSFYISYSWLKLLNHNTRNDAISWLEKNANGEVIYNFDRYIDPSLNYEAALWHRDNNARQLSKKLSYVIEHKEEFENKGLNLRYDYGANRYEDLAGTSTKYLLVSYWTDQNGGKYFWGDDINLALKEISKYHTLERVQTFFPVSDGVTVGRSAEDILNNPIYWSDLTRLQASGPFVEIYRIIN